MVCKTVGFAYPGSNPGPATTCGNAPLAANSRLRGAFCVGYSGATLLHFGSRCCCVHGRIADGVQGLRGLGGRTDETVSEDAGYLVGVATANPVSTRTSQSASQPSRAAAWS